MLGFRSPNPRSQSKLAFIPSHVRIPLVHKGLSLRGEALGGSWQEQAVPPLPISQRHTTIAVAHGWAVSSERKSELLYMVS